MNGVSAAVFVCSFALLAYEAAHTQIAGRYVDPVSRIEAQDEALYAHSAIRMDERGGWLTPMFRDRYALYKPPLLIWLTALSARLFGVSAFALRLPSLIAGALIACVVFQWLRQVRSFWAALAGLALLLSNHLWQVLCCLCLTDALLSACIAGAVFCLLRDSRLERPSSFYGFSLFTAGAVLTKSVAGLLPILILLGTCALARRFERPLLRRIAHACLLIAAVSLPWFVYQAIVHTRWFWGEHVGLEILTFGIGRPPQTTPEGQVGFYARRLLLTSPAMVVLGALALPGFWIELRRKRSLPAAILCSWIVVVIASVMAWSYHSIAYLLPGLAALAILAAGYGPLFTGRRAPVMLAALCVLLAAKAAFPHAPWGTALRAPDLIPSTPVLADYCRKNCGHELIIVEPDDAFHASLLPLARVRYCFIDPNHLPPASGLDLHYLGIMVSAGEFTDLPRLQPIFRERLRQWDLDSDEPIGDVIVAQSRQDVLKLVSSHPASDFLMRDSFRGELDPTVTATHEVAPAQGGKILLLSKSPAMTDTPARRSCGL